MVGEKMSQDGKRPSQQGTEKKMTISAVIIVRDEEKYIGRCLESLMGIVDEIVVVDTGSKDNTIQIVSSFEVKLHHVTWNDSFSHARNAGIDCATGPYILTIDGDEWISNRKSAREHLQTFITTNGTEMIGSVELTNLTGEQLGEVISTHTLSRFFHKMHYHYEGRIHEQLVGKGGKHPVVKPTGVTLDHAGYARESQALAEKWERNKRHLLTAIHDNENDEYLFFSWEKRALFRKTIQAPLRH